MARFNPRKYDPKTDSTPEVADLANGVVILRGQGLCACGCGKAPQTAKSRFAQGHDARLRGRLMRAHVTGTPVTIAMKNGGDEPHVEKTTTAIEVAEQESSPEHWTAFLERARERWEQKAVNKAKTGQLKVGDVVPVKVGRWSYDGRITEMTEDEVTVEYATKSGEVKDVTLALGELKDSLRQKAEAGSAA